MPKTKNNEQQKPIFEIKRGKGWIKIWADGHVEGIKKPITINRIGRYVEKAVKDELHGIEHRVTDRMGVKP